MKNIFLAFALLAAFAVPTVAHADIAPDPTPYIVPSQPTGYIVEEGVIVDREEPRLTTEENVLMQFPRALYLTLIIELVIAAIIVAQQKLARRVLFSVPLATLATLPLFWTWYIHTWPYAVAVFVAECVVITAETAILYYTQRPAKLSVKQALAISAAMNVVSVMIGYALTSP